MSVDEDLRNFSVKLDMGFNAHEISKLNISFDKVIRDLEHFGIDRDVLEAVFYAGAHTMKNISPFS